MAAQTGLAMLYEKGLGVEQNLTEAIRWYARAGHQGDADSQFALATIFEQGRGVRSDPRKAIAWLGQAAKTGDARAQTRLALIFDAARWSSAISRRRLNYSRKRPMQVIFRRNII